MRYYLSIFTIVAVLLGGILISPTLARADDAVTQAQLEQELRDIEQQITLYTNELAQTQTQKATLANKIKQLQAQQKTLSLKIKSINLELNTIGGKISSTTKNISSNTIKQQRLIDDMGTVLRQMNAVDENLLMNLVTPDGWAAAYNRVRDYTQLTDALIVLAGQTREIKKVLLSTKEQLEDQKTDASNLLKIQSIQQQGLLGTLNEQGELLAQTKGVESNYQKILADKKKRAAEIRNRIYELFNSTGSQITFGKAVEIAKWVSTQINIRPAFLLAILTQESSLGKNIGTCNRAGDPESKSWKVIMKPERDQEPFKTITSELGLNIDTTPVSCPMKDKNGKQVGWGGAMGPAQFIPSTWMGYRSKITKYNGKSTANPWDIRDAFLAAAIKLTADGADGTDKGDWTAAMKYFSGSTNLKYRFYGDNVLATTKKYLADIGEL